MFSFIVTTHPSWRRCGDGVSTCTTRRLVGMGDVRALKATAAQSSSGGVAPIPETASNRVVPSTTPTTTISTARLYEKNGRVFEELSWGCVSQLSAQLVNALDGGNWDLVLAVTRGGLVPAALVAEGLGVRNVLAATVMFYTDEGNVFYGLHQPRFLAFPSTALLKDRNVLVVDDVWDSGRTARAVRERVVRSGAKKVAVAVLHFKEMESESGKPEYFAATTANRWILYPWEVLAVEHVTGSV